MGEESSAGGLRQKQQHTRARLISRARTLTAEHGLSGYTVQELCDFVGISRRTFFNYFASKEDAVLGIGSGVDGALVDRFRQNVSARLIDDLATLAIAHFTAVGHTREDAAEFSAALRREPALLTALLKSGQQEQNSFVKLVAEREGLTVAVDDLTSPQVAVALVSSLMLLSAEAFFAEENTRSFDEVFRQRLAAAQHLFAPATAAAADPAPAPEPTPHSRPRELVTQ